jgi:hypothetical protein
MDLKNNLGALGLLIQTDENDTRFLLESSLAKYDSVKLITEAKLKFIDGWYHIYITIGTEGNITIKTHKNKIRKYREATRLLSLLRATCPNVETITICNREIIT